jgi:hypothetical protein
LEGQGRSEGLVLKRTVEFMREKIEERRGMVDEIEKAGGEVDEKLKRSAFSSHCLLLSLCPCRRLTSDRPLYRQTRS